MKDDQYSISNGRIGGLRRSRVSFEEDSRFDHARENDIGRFGGCGLGEEAEGRSDREAVGLKTRRCSRDVPFEFVGKIAGSGAVANAGDI
jgi:hypothetical protein